MAIAGRELTPVATNGNDTTVLPVPSLTISSLIFVHGIEEYHMDDGLEQPQGFGMAATR